MSRAMTVDMDDYMGPIVRNGLKPDLDQWIKDTGIGAMACIGITFYDLSDDPTVVRFGETVDILTVENRDGGLHQLVIEGFRPSSPPPFLFMQWLARRTPDRKVEVPS